MDEVFKQGFIALGGVLLTPHRDKEKDEPDPRYTFPFVGGNAANASQLFGKQFDIGRSVNPPT